MRTEISLLLMLIIVLLLTQANAQEQTDTQQEIDYCYKPSKPLFLSTAQSKKRYQEDMLEYQRCQKYFVDMRKRVARIKKESDEESQRIMNHYQEQLDD